MLRVFGIGLLVVTAVLPARAGVYQPTTLADESGEAEIRRTDPGADDDVGESTHRKPDILSVTLGRWQPPAPHVSVYDGDWDAAGSFLRLDLLFDGLINPAGPVLSTAPTYDPYRYGPNPVVGFLELDVDSDNLTGGEVGFPQIRYLANVARFGGALPGAAFANRIVNGWDFAGDGLATPPFYCRSGEEFHLVLRGDELTAQTEELGNGDQVLDPGEVWRVKGRFLHRAHGYETYSLSMGPPPGAYLPMVELRYASEPAFNRTRITLIYPLTQAASAAQLDQSVVEPLDGSADNQNSIEEALDDLIFSVQSYGWDDPARDDPVFSLLAEWEGRSVAPFLSAETWRATLLAGMPYVLAPGADRFAWTDVLPQPRFGDVDGSTVRDMPDRDAVTDFVELYDGVAPVDQGLGGDQRVDLGSFGPNFNLYDINYDGAVDLDDADEIHYCGDMNTDGDVNALDVPVLIAAMLDPNSPALPAPYPALVYRGDFNNDGLLDSDDLQGFVDVLINGSRLGIGNGISPHRVAR